jgi:phosphoglycerate dehydrogenase-like enzyme
MPTKSGMNHPGRKTLESRGKPRLSFFLPMLRSMDLSSMASETVCVTGGAGFIGSHLVEALVRTGAKVRVLDDFSSGDPANLAKVEPKITLIEGSILDDCRNDRGLSPCRQSFRD